MNSCAPMSTVRPLFLSQEEAVALLEICLLAQTGDDPVKAEAMRKIGDLCREFYRGGSLDALPPGRDNSTDRAPVAETIELNVELVPAFA